MVAYQPRRNYGGFPDMGPGSRPLRGLARGIGKSGKGLVARGWPAVGNPIPGVAYGANPGSWSGGPAPYEESAKAESGGRPLACGGPINDNAISVVFAA